MPWVFQPCKEDILLANKGFSLDSLSLRHVFFVILVTGILGGGTQALLYEYTKCTHSIVFNSYQ